jgi:hypothetical protein
MREFTARIQRRNSLTSLAVLDGRPIQTLDVPRCSRWSPDSNSRRPSLFSMVARFKLPTSPLFPIVAQFKATSVWRSRTRSSHSLVRMIGDPRCGYNGEIVSRPSLSSMVALFKAGVGLAAANRHSKEMARVLLAAVRTHRLVGDHPIVFRPQRHALRSANRTPRYSRRRRTHSTGNRRGSGALPARTSPSPERHRPCSTLVVRRDHEHRRSQRLCML